MDRIPSDGHCTYRCRSRTGKPAAAHPHRGGWYVFAQTKPQLQIQSTPLNHCSSNTNNYFYNSLLLLYPFCLPLIRLSPLETFSLILDFALFFQQTNCDSLCESTFFWGYFFPLTLLNFNTWYGIFNCRPPTSSPNCHF